MSVMSPNHRLRTRRCPGLTRNCRALHVNLTPNRSTPGWGVIRGSSCQLPVIGLEVLLPLIYIRLPARHRATKPFIYPWLTVSIRWSITSRQGHRNPSRFERRPFRWFLGI
jgi:hypothetical protein